MTNYSTYYLTDVRLILLTKYNYKRLHDIDSISRVDLNLSAPNSKYIVNTLAALSLLSNQGQISYNNLSGNKPVYSKAPTQNHLTITSSICGTYIFNFIENLVSYYIPRIRFFKGFPSSNLNSFGNFTFVTRDLMVFPELEEELEIFYKLKDLKISFILKDKIGANPVFFYSLFGFHFLN